MLSWMCCVWLIFVPLCWRRRNSAELPPLEHSKKYLVQQKGSNRICPQFFLLHFPEQLWPPQGPIGTSKKNWFLQRDLTGYVRKESFLHSHEAIGTSKKNFYSKGTLADKSAKNFVLHFPEGNRDTYKNGPSRHFRKEGFEKVIFMTPLNS